MAQYSLQKPKQYLHLNFVSSTAYTSVFWHCCLVSCMRMRKCKRIEFWTCNDRPHPSPQANSSCIESLCAMASYCSAQTSILLDYWIRETGMIKNRLPRLLLHERLNGPLSMACEHEVLCSSVLGMHLHDHHVCAHSPTVLTNPKRSESASFMPSR